MRRIHIQYGVLAALGIGVVSTLLMSSPVANNLYGAIILGDDATQPQVTCYTCDQNGNCVGTSSLYNTCPAGTTTDPLCEGACSPPLQGCEFIDCNDMDECTTDSCIEIGGTPTCQYTQNPNCGTHSNDTTGNDVGGNDVDGGGNDIDGGGNDIDGGGNDIDGGGNDIDGGGNDIDGGGNDIDGGGNDIDGGDGSVQCETSLDCPLFLLEPQGCKWGSHPEDGYGCYGELFYQRCENGTCANAPGGKQLAACAIDQCEPQYLCNTDTGNCDQCDPVQDILCRDDGQSDQEACSMQCYAKITSNPACMVCRKSAGGRWVYSPVNGHDDQQACRDDGGYVFVRHQDFDTSVYGAVYLTSNSYVSVCRSNGPRNGTFCGGTGFAACLAEGGACFPGKGSTTNRYYFTDCPTCGNGLHEAPEQCDDGALNGRPGYCTNECYEPYCGDGKVDKNTRGKNEECDCHDVEPRLGSSQNVPTEVCTYEENGKTITCSTSCKAYECGNGRVDPGEDCDEGRDNGTSFAPNCSSECKAFFCGDKKVTMGEQCDLGAECARSGTDCTACLIENGGVDKDCCGANDWCNPKRDPALDNAQLYTKYCSGCQEQIMRYGQCGDGEVGIYQDDNGNWQAEQCDSGYTCANGRTCNPNYGCGNIDGSTCTQRCNAESACNTDCTTPVCGNGVVECGEECEPATADDPSCTKECTIPDSANTSGGNGGGGGSECSEDSDCTGNDECCSFNDDGNTCEPCNSGNAVCGNGTKEGDEECDDGNRTDGDGCNDECKEEITVTNNNCGNRIIDNGEECDQGVGNGERDSFCRSDCTQKRCGDGTNDGSYIFINAQGQRILQIEECDDGNQQSGDGCSNTCRDETGQNGICGDGNLDTDSDEECDDGNTEDGDGCTASCTLEPSPFCGDGEVNNVNEECDDGNQEDGDGCNDQCYIEVCGDGQIGYSEEQQGLEECDPTGGCYKNGQWLAWIFLKGQARGCRMLGGTVIPYYSNECDNDCTVPLCGDDNLNKNTLCQSLSYIPDDDGYAFSCIPSGEARLKTTCSKQSDCRNNQVCKADGYCWYVHNQTEPHGEVCETGKRVCADRYICENSGVECIPKDQKTDMFITNNIPMSNECAPNEACIPDVQFECTTAEDEQRCQTRLSPNDGPYSIHGTRVGCMEVNDDECDRDCTEPFCGDRIINFKAGEECDFGYTCGANGKAVGPVTVCDPERPSSCSSRPGTTCGVHEVLGCSSECKMFNTSTDTNCGNGIEEQLEGEECDDGNTESGDGCSAQCKYEYCGDGTTQPDLTVRPSQGRGTAWLRDLLLMPFRFVGNLVADILGGDDPVGGQQGGGGNGGGLKEQCDDGNTNNTDGCNNQCQRICNNNDTCEANESCQCSDCVNTPQCIQAACNNNDVCDANETCNCRDCAGHSQCTPPPCDNDATCEEGETCQCSDCANTPQCTSGSCDNDNNCDPEETCSCNDCAEADLCRQLACGNAQLDEGELCDLGTDDRGNRNGREFVFGECRTIMCNRDCSLPRCGDGIVNTCFVGRTPRTGGTPEQCDDGNTTSGDGCSSTCQIEENPECNFDGSCGLNELCRCRDCADALRCVEPRCRNEGRCTPDEACTCRDCRTADRCTESCNNNGQCDANENCECGDCSSTAACTEKCNNNFICENNETCSCSDCSSKPECDPATCNNNGQCEADETCRCSDCATTDLCTLPFHLDCVDKACKLVPGAGRDLCSNDDECIGDPEEFHTDCDGNVCRILPGDGPKNCVPSLGCGPNQHLECIENTCTMVSGGGANQCGDEGSICESGTYGVCENKACVQRTGNLDSECAVDSDCDPVSICGNEVVEGDEECDDGNIEDGDGCSAECTEEIVTLFHTVCEEDACVLVEGEGDNGCALSLGCGVDERLKCVNNTCTMVEESGPNRCDVEGEECETGTYGACENQSCVLKIGDAEPECAVGNDSDCNPVEICGNEVIEGDEECDDGNIEDGDGCSAECTEEIVTLFHTVCEEDACVLVEGQGESICSLSLGCDTEQRLKCVNNACTLVDESGPNRCNDDSQCVEGMYLDCVNNACTMVEGNRDNQCGNDSDCRTTICNGNGTCDGNETCSCSDCVDTNQCNEQDDDDGTVDDDDSGVDDDDGSEDDDSNGTEDDDGQGEDDDGIPDNDDGDQNNFACQTDLDCTWGVCKQGDCRPCVSSSECKSGECLEGVCSTPNLIAAGTICGNGILEDNEECDDSNRRDNDGCSATCQLEIGICGDGVVQKLLGEQCEPSTHRASLPYTCKNCRFLSPTCGNGTLDPGEECDLGDSNSDAPNSSCRTDCSASRCGDGVVDSSEQCDDGNRLSRDGCDRYCNAENTLVASQEQTPEVIPFDVLSASVTQERETIAFPYEPSKQALPYTLPLAQLQPLVQGQAPVGDTGPAAVAVIGAGAAAGWSWMKRKKK